MRPDIECISIKLSQVFIKFLNKFISQGFILDAFKFCHGMAGRLVDHQRLEVAREWVGILGMRMRSAQ